MNTKKTKAKSLLRVRKSEATDKEDALVALVDEMMSIDTKSKRAKENEFSFQSESGERIVYFLTKDMIKKSDKNKKDFSQKWIELLVLRRLLGKLLKEAREILEDNKRFHCYGHAVEVLLNTEKLIRADGEANFDRKALYAAALFHDASNYQDEREGIDGAKIAERVLADIKDFPKDKIADVKRLIESISRKPKGKDEVLITTADEMAAFSPLGLARSLMISGSKNMKVQAALEWELGYLEKRYKNIRLESARKMVKNQYKAKKHYLEQCLRLYR